MKPVTAGYLKERRVEPRTGEEHFIRLGEVLATCASRGRRDQVRHSDTD